MQLLLRFLIGGLVVSAFAALADVLKPKSFAGLFGAAPSISLATITLTVSANGAAYAALEARSMMAGACAFILYAILCLQLLARFRWTAMKASTFSLLAWFAAAFSLWFFLLR